MKRIQLFSYALCALAMSGLASCSSTGGYSSSSSSTFTSPYSASPFSSWYDSPMGRQIRMQEAHGRVTRSLIPF